MNKVLQVKSKISSLNSEFYNFSALYNLHIIEIKNLFNHSILLAYSDILKDEYNIATLLNCNQAVLYFTPDKRSKTINISMEMFHKIWKHFLREIEKLSIKNSSNEFYSSLTDKSFANVIIKRISSANIYFKTITSNTVSSRNLEFSYKPKSLREREFLLKNNDLWIYLSPSLQSKLVKHKDILAKLKTPMILKINPFNSMFTYKIVQDLTDKIRAKSSNKVDIRIVNVNEKKMIITLKIKIFIPLAFIDYIKEYVHNNTLYEVQFANIKQN